MKPRTVICGSFKRDNAGLQQLYNELVTAGYDVLSPLDVEFVSHIDGFARGANEEDQSVLTLENKHIEAIKSSDCIWLHCPDGYIGLSAALEIGVAISLGIPIKSLTKPNDITLTEYIEVTASVEGANIVSNIPSLPLRVLQSYYAQRAQERGFGDESARDTVLLMTEELGELARAVRKHAGIARWNPREENIAGEIADIQLYLLHLANIVEVDLHTAVVEKEQHNEARYNATKQ